MFFAYAPFTYNIYLGIHVLAAVTWVGGDITLTTLGIVFERRSEGETLSALGRMGAWIGTRVYTHRRSSSRLRSESHSWSRATWTGASSGFSLDSSAGQSQPSWAWASSAPNWAESTSAARTHGPDSVEVARRVQRLFMIFRFDTALLMLIVINMAAKPSF